MKNIELNIDIDEDDPSSVSWRENQVTGYRREPFYVRLQHYFFPDTPKAAELIEWDKIHAEQKKRRPVAYFILHTMMNWLAIRKRIFWSDPIWWVKTRVLPKYRKHVANTTLTPGWHDVDTRLIHAMFNMLVEFVEYEKAHMEYTMSNSTREYQKDEMWGTHWWHRLTLRSKELGFRYLEWEVSLKDYNEDSKIWESQALIAKEIMEIYVWWTERYLKRCDILDIPELVAIREEREELRIDVFENGPEDFEERKTLAYKRMYEIEQDRSQEEKDMMKRLIDIKEGLWT